MYPNAWGMPMQPMTTQTQTQGGGGFGMDPQTMRMYAQVLGRMAKPALQNAISPYMGGLRNAVNSTLAPIKPYTDLTGASGGMVPPMSGGNQGFTPLDLSGGQANSGAWGLYDNAAARMPSNFGASAPSSAAAPFGWGDPSQGFASMAPEFAAEGMYGAAVPAATEGAASSLGASGAASAGGGLAGGLASGGMGALGNLAGSYHVGQLGLDQGWGSNLGGAAGSIVGGVFGGPFGALGGGAAGQITGAGLERLFRGIF
jgi:hypothetical protein